MYSKKISSKIFQIKLYISYSKILILTDFVDMLVRY